MLTSIKSLERSEAKIGHRCAPIGHVAMSWLVANGVKAAPGEEILSPATKSDSRISLG